MQTPKTLPTYSDRHPLASVADFYGLNWQHDVLAQTDGDHYIEKESYRRWTIKNVVISIYRLHSGNYELTHYMST